MGNKYAERMVLTVSVRYIWGVRYSSVECHFMDIQNQRVVKHHRIPLFAESARISAYIFPLTVLLLCCWY